MKSDPTSTNRFCKLSILTNEASVETFFVNRLLQDLGVPRFRDQDQAIDKGTEDTARKPHRSCTNRTQ